MDLHRLGELRSLAYHRAIAARIASEPVLVAAARETLARWQAAGRAPYYLGRWAEWLALQARDLATRITDDSDDACAMRSCSPFAGLLDPRERWRIWRSVRDEVEGGR